MGYWQAINKKSLRSPLIRVEGTGFLAILIRREVITSARLSLKNLHMFREDLEFTTRIFREFKMFVLRSSKLLYQRWWERWLQRKLLEFSSAGSSTPIAHVWRSRMDGILGRLGKRITAGSPCLNDFGARRPVAQEIEHTKMRPVFAIGMRRMLFLTGLHRKQP
jgi:hypothetical protein